MPVRARWSRQRSIRALLALGFVVPVVCSLALWAFGTDVTVTHAGAEHDFTTADGLYTGPAQALSSALAVEQREAVTWLSGRARAPLATLRAQFPVTDQAVASFLAATRADDAVIPSAARPALRALDSLLAGRATLRANAQAGQLSALSAVHAYGAIQAAVVSFDAKLLVVDDASLSRQAAASVEADQAVALASSEIALTDGAVAAGGAMSTAESALFVQDAAGSQLMLSNALTVLNPTLAAGYLQVTDSAAYRAFATAASQIAASAGNSGLAPIDAPELAASAGPLSTDYHAAQRQDATSLASLAAHAGGQATAVAVLVAGLGLVAVLLSAVLAIWLWWRIARDVTGLRDAARTLVAAQPSSPERPSADAPGDGPGGVAPLPAGRIREVAQASAALFAARQLTEQAVAAQSQLRSGTGHLFRKLGLRSHALAQRQLRLLAVIETSTSDRQVIAGLAAVGQLSTRLQRQADGLVVLSGGSLTSSGPESLRIGDLLRAVTGEVDDGSRITIVSDSADAVTAEAAADVLHLITELVENAAQHTPPLAEVTVRVGRVGRGLVVEVEDRGPGMAVDTLAALNALLADPPDIGLAAVDGLGLLVAARLAGRHGITVSLRRSPAGGTTAIVLLPHAILITGDVRDTIIDGSLPRIDALLGPPTVAPSATATPRPPPPAALRPPAFTTSLPPSQSPESAPATPSPLPARLPRRVVDPDAATIARDGGRYLPAERAAAPAASTAPAAENLAPWHWLTESQPALTSAPDPADGPSAGSGEHGVHADPNVPTALPRRIRPGGPPFGRAASSLWARTGPDEAAAPPATDAGHATDHDDEAGRQ
jgi:signal transduction histidine kinase